MIDLTQPDTKTVMSSYTKLFSHIITSSVWSEDDQTRILWITMLALADKHGEVMAAVPGLAKVAALSVEATRKAIVQLESPDPDSRTPDEEGRRIIKIPGGWHIVNHAKHRRMASVDEVKEKNAARQRRWYARQKNLTLSITNGNDSNATITPCNAPITHETDNAEADADTDTKYRAMSTGCKERVQREENPSSPTVGRGKSVQKEDPEFLRFWSELPNQNKIGKRKAHEAWDKAIKDGSTADQIIAGISAYKKYERRRREQADYRPLHPTTWLNQGRWEDFEEDNGTQSSSHYNPRL